LAALISPYDHSLTEAHSRYSFGFHPGCCPGSFTVVDGKLIANFYYEALDMSEEEFDESRNRILGGVRVSE
jgi:hypothetical protein